MLVRGPRAEAGGMSDRQRGLKRFVGGIYSSAAERFYEPMVVQGAFRLFGGELNQRIIELQTAAVASAPGEAVLDMPTGTGYFTVELGGAHDGLVVAADIASGMVRESAAAAREAGLDNVRCVQADVHRLPFPDGAFSIVFCWNGLQVMPGLDASVAELGRVTAPGGRMLASTLHLPLGAASAYYCIPTSPGGPQQPPAHGRGVRSSRLACHLDDRRTTVDDLRHAKTRIAA